jgi:hypothetical protein
MGDFTTTLKSRVSALAENARDFTLEFESLSSSQLFDTDEQTLKDLHTSLSARLDKEKLEALRRLVAVPSPNNTPPPLHPCVVIVLSGLVS